MEYSKPANASFLNTCFIPFLYCKAIINYLSEDFLLIISSFLLFVLKYLKIIGTLIVVFEKIQVVYSFKYLIFEIHIFHCIIPKFEFAALFQTLSQHVCLKNTEATASNSELLRYFKIQILIKRHLYKLSSLRFSKVFTIDLFQQMKLEFHV